jgi:hypothetical protein
VTIENMKSHLNLLKGKKGHKRVNQSIKREKGKKGAPSIIMVLSISNFHLRDLFVAL